MILIHRTLEFFLYPPGNVLLFALLGLAFYRYPVIKYGLIGFGIAQLIFFSLPVVSNALMASLESQYPPTATLWATQRADAIVVLGASRNDRAVEFGGVTVGTAEIERLRYAALLHRKTGLPILLTGGDPINSGFSEAFLMKQVLKDEFSIEATWLEENSHTTWENAALSNAMLSKAGVKKAWLVTHAWHMPRSMMVFADRSVEYLPAPHNHGIFIWDKLWMKWVPQARALGLSTIAMHEWLGLLWYKLRQ
ncbi:MAG: YdcF family protein [Leucothrix sp.]